MSICSNVHELRENLLEDQAVAALAQTFRVLGDATRVRILDAISRTELCVGDIAELLGLSESAVSHQLRLLRGMRLVRPRRAGQLIYYSLDDHHIVELFEQGLKHVQERAADSVVRDHAAADALQRLASKSSAQAADRARGGDPLERA